MEEIRQVLVVGGGKLACSVTTCLLQAGHPVTLWTDDIPGAEISVSNHLSDLDGFSSAYAGGSGLTIIQEMGPGHEFQLCIILASENQEVKKEFIRRVEEKLSGEAIIAINTESIFLDKLQDATVNPKRIIGLNWVEPAHTTFFLEIISNGMTDQKCVDEIFNLAKRSWRKDPYQVSAGFSIRTRLMVALIREAFHLISQGYASVEDIDRACRNDAGYYLPFAGNGRYMDLMGTYAYGLVMKDLNPELAKDSTAPEFFNTLIRNGHTGLENGEGFYSYSDKEAAEWTRTIRTFSHQIREIISRYPFNYKQPELIADPGEIQAPILDQR